MRLRILILTLLNPVFLSAQTYTPPNMAFIIPDFEMITYDEVAKRLNDSDVVIDTQLLPDEYAGIYQLNDQFLIQFFNGTGVLLPPGAPVHSISEVSFHPSFYPFKNTGLTYSMDITESVFNELGGANEEIEGLGHHGKVEFFRGKHNLMLAFWSPAPSIKSFLIVESPLTMASFDLEMGDYIPLGDADSSRLVSTGKPAYQAQEKDYFLFDFVDGRCTNIDDAREQLSEMLLIRTDRLDYSEASLTMLDKALFWNMNRVNAYALSRSLTAYMGECILRAKGDGWSWNKQLAIISTDGNELHISGGIHNSIIDNDHGWFVKHIYEEAMR